MTVTVTNNSGKDLLVNQGFHSKPFHLEMRLIDPAGRLLLPKCDQPRNEFPDTPPLAFAECVNVNGVPRVAPYEVFPMGVAYTQIVPDLRECYPIKLSGQYSAEVQLSVMVFKSGQGG